MSVARWKAWGSRLLLAGAPLLLLSVAAALAARHEREKPFTPASDAEPLERLPFAAADPTALELAAEERRVRAEPSRLEPRLVLARHCIELYRQQADPRYLGRARAVLEPELAAPAPPPPLRLLRAVMAQSNHEFERALDDLDVLVRETPADAEAWLTRAVVESVLGRYAAALSDCGRTGALAGALVASVCSAAPLALTGAAPRAERALSEALAAARRAPPSERAWALSTLAELDVVLGRPAGPHFEAALALAPADPYTLAAYADWLLDRGDLTRVTQLLRGFERMDALLLRLAIAERRLDRDRSAELTAELAARFAAARLRGDGTHRREQARFELELRDDPRVALELARANWGVQRELADARILLETALAAGEPNAAGRAAEVLETAGVREPRVRALLARLRGAS